MKQIITRILPVIGIIAYTHTSAQWNDAIVQDSTANKVAAGIYGSADYGSTCVTNTFAANILTGSFITDAMKQQVSSKLEESNRLGYNLNYGIYGVWYNDTAKKRKMNFFFALRHKSYINADFAPDVFNLAFYGNAMYAGQTAKLVPFSFNSLSYQQAEIGLVCTNFGGKGEFGIGLSFLAGQRLLSINAYSASLYTDPTGQNLQFSSDADLYESDTAGNSKLINGYGASIDLYFKAPYKIGKRNGTISISITDIGFMYWNNKSLYYYKDTSYYYDGVTINSLNDLQNVSFNTVSKDSLQNKYLPFEKTSFITNIPATFSINSNTDYGKYHLEIGYWYIFNENAVGYGYVQGDRIFTNGWITSLQLGYGGYETINAALLFSKQCHNSKFSMVINHLEGLVLPNLFGGAGISLEYVHSFGK